MSLIVETGDLAEGANVYCDVAFADGYLGDRGFSDWPSGDGETAAKSAALIKAADYLNGLKWYGKKAKGESPRIMAWPRVGAFDSDGDEIVENVIPYAVKAANAYLARLAYSGTDLQPILEHGARISSESVDSLSTSYFEDAPTRDIYAGLADLLRGLSEEFDGFAGTGNASKNKARVFVATT
jgi:hypothetical protein